MLRTVANNRLWICKNKARVICSKRNRKTKSLIKYRTPLGHIFRRQWNFNFTTKWSMDKHLTSLSFLHSRIVRTRFEREAKGKAKGKPKGKIMMNALQRRKLSNHRKLLMLYLPMLTFEQSNIIFSVLCVLCFRHSITTRWLFNRLLIEGNRWVGENETFYSSLRQLLDAKCWKGK